MNKKILLIGLIAVVLALTGGGYYYWRTKMRKVPEPPKSAAEQAVNDIQKTAAGISSDVGKNVSPNVAIPSVNPINADVNPYNKANPFSNLKVNPFQ